MKRNRYPVWQAVLWVCCAWVLLVLLHSSDRNMSFSVLGYSYGREHIIQQSGSTIIGEFTATENNLGIIDVRVDTARLGEMNKIRFRLKDKSSNTWYYDNEYRVTKLANTALFPFGFPPINNSKGKEYMFELQIAAADPGNVIAVTTQYPVVDAYYKFYKKDLLKSPTAFMTFLTKKIILSFSDMYEIIYLSLFLAVPLAVYWVGKRIGFVWTERYLPFILLLFLIMDNIFIAFKTSELISIVLNILLLLCMRYLRSDSSVSFFFAFMYLFFTAVLFFIGTQQAIDKSAIWAYIFLGIGLCQSYWEVKHSSRGLVNLKKIFVIHHHR